MLNSSVGKAAAFLAFLIFHPNIISYMTLWLPRRKKIKNHSWPLWYLAKMV